MLRLTGLAAVAASLAVGAAGTKELLLRGAARGRLERADDRIPYSGDWYRDLSHGWVYSYANPYAENTAGWDIQPTWGQGYNVVDSGAVGKKFDEAKWAWISPEDAGGDAPAPAPPPGPAPPPPAPEGNSLHESLDCKGFYKAAKQDNPDNAPFECHLLRFTGTSNVFHSPGIGCYCYAWSSNCPYETCTVSHTWEGDYCLDPKVKAFGLEGISKWQVNPADNLFGGFKHHASEVSLCAYWNHDQTASGPGFKPVAKPDPATYRKTMSVLVFQGLTLAGCYDATQVANYDKTSKAVAKALGVKVVIMYMICAEGGAEPEWKLLQLRETTRRSNHSHHPKISLLENNEVEGVWHPKAPDMSKLQEGPPAPQASGLSLLQEPQERDLGGRTPCVIAIANGERNKEGCPTDPPIMFPYTPTATLTVEVTGLQVDVDGATALNEKPDFCVKGIPSKLQPEICTQWESGKPCCPVAPVTPEPSAPAA